MQRMILALALIQAGQHVYVNDPANAPADTHSLAEIRQQFAGPLSNDEANEAKDRFLAAHRQRIKSERKSEMENRSIKMGDHDMPFFYKVFGDKPKDGRSMFISMHGGGGAPKRVNNRQWNNQKRLYQPTEGVYVAPRAPTDDWNLWHQAHIDGFFDRLIENMIAIEDVDPNRVYLMGYSAGGDGVYQLAPRMADRWAAAAMMAGHPNDASPLGLRNIGFALYMGGRDDAYNRNKVAAEWKGKLAKLQVDDQGGYKHLVTIYPDKGHWMDGEDATSVAWMQEFTRNPFPKRLIWKQDDVTQARFYWLKVDDDHRTPGSVVKAKLDSQTITLDLGDVKKLHVRLNDSLVDLDQPVRIVGAEGELFSGRVTRTLSIIEQTIAERGDPCSVYSAEVIVEIP